MCPNLRPGLTYRIKIRTKNFRKISVMRSWTSCAMGVKTTSIGTTLTQVMACYLTAPIHYLNQTSLSQFADTALTVSKCLSLGLCKGSVGGLAKQWKFPHALRREHDNPNLYLEQLIIIGWCQHGHVTYPTDSPTATRLGLCNSLPTWNVPHWPPYCHQVRAV